MDERVWVKVVEVGEDERGPRIGCSLKLVSQSDGRDMVSNSQSNARLQVANFVAFDKL